MESNNPVDVFNKHIEDFNSLDRNSVAVKVVVKNIILYWKQEANLNLKNYLTNLGYKTLTTYNKYMFVIIGKLPTKNE